jgi:hypothetical protein
MNIHNRRPSHYRNPIGRILPGLLLPCLATVAFAAATLQLEFRYEDTGTTTTNSGLMGGSASLLNSTSAATDLHGAAGSGLLGGADQALDLTSATGMGSGFTGPRAVWVNNTKATNVSWTAMTWYKTASTAPLGTSARIAIFQDDTLQVLGGRSGTPGEAAVFGPGGPGTVNSGVNTYTETQSWVFLATTYSTGVVSFYKGTPTTAVTLVTNAAFTTGAASPLALNNLIIGNRTAASRPFDGYLDNTRFWDDGGAGDDSGALSEAALEIMRTLDLGLPTPPLANKPLVSPGTTVWEGTTVTLTEIAGAGVPTSYQWRKDGTNILGATSSTLELASATPQDSGSYDVVVGNDAGSTTSPAVTLMVRSNIPPTFLSQPASGTRYIGGYLHFAPVVDGPPPFSYQWRFNGNPIAGGTNLVLHISNLVATNAGTYKLYVTNAFGNAVGTDITIATIAPAAGSYEEMIVAAQPTGYWRLNEGPTPATGFDYAGGNDLTHTGVVLTNGPRTGDGFPGLGSTNGAAFYDSYLSSGSETVGTLMNNLTSFTLCGWFNMAYAPPARTALFGQDGQAELGFPTADKLEIYVAGGTTASIDITNFTLGQWYFIAAVGNTANNTVKLYLNGNEVASSVGSKSVRSTTTPFRVGYGVLDPGGNWFDGAIDEVALYGRALSPTEISTLYSKASGVVLAPGIVAHPAPVTRCVGASASFSVQPSGTLPLTYKWKKGASYLSNGGRISGADTDTLTISGILVGDDADYSAEVSNSAGSATSNPAHLTVVPGPAGAYGAKAVALGAYAYWQLNEGSGTAYDYCGGFNGTYGVNSQQGPGPRSPALVGFESTNNALVCASLSGSAAVVVPPLNLNSDVCTITAWVNPANATNTWRGLFFTRGGDPDTGGLFLASDNELRYTWANENYSWASGLLVPTNTWSFVAVVIQPTNATMYLGTPMQGLVTAAQVATNIVQEFGSDAYIGQDSPTDGYLLGSVDEVAVYRKALTPADIEALYANGSGVVQLGMSRSGGNLILSWPAGTLQSADEVNGTYTDVGGASSPWPVSPTAARKFYRVRVP